MVAYLIKQDIDEITKQSNEVKDVCIVLDKKEVFEIVGNATYRINYNKNYFECVVNAVNRVPKIEDLIEIGSKRYKIIKVENMFCNLYKVLVEY